MWGVYKTITVLAPSRLSSNFPVNCVPIFPLRGRPLFGSPNEKDQLVGRLRLATSLGQASFR